MRHKRFMEGAALLGLLCLGCEPSFEQLRENAYTEMRTGNLIAARGLFKAAADKKPESPDVLYSIARIYHAFGELSLREKDIPGAMRDLDYALHYYDRAVEAYPGYEAALRGKNRVYELRGQFDQALQVARWAARNAGPNARQHAFLADELEERGDLDNALLRLRQAVKMEPRNARAHMELGRFHLRNRQPKLAAEEFQVAYQLDPNLPGLAADLEKLGYQPVLADGDPDVAQRLPEDER